MIHRNLGIQLFLYSCLFLLASCAYAEARIIEVNGTAKQSLEPDIAKFSFTINVHGKELTALKTNVDTKTAELVKVCEKLGVSKRDISSAEVSIHPQYNHQTRTLLAYSVSRTVKVTLREIAKYSDIMNGAIAAGVNTVGRVILDVEDRDALQEKALSAAVANARKKAEILASSAGVSLGNVISLREISSGRGVEPYRFTEQAVSSRVPGSFEPGEITLSTSVTVNYAIK